LVKAPGEPPSDPQARGLVELSQKLIGAPADPSVALADLND
jgi:hypothetical protein